MTTSTVTPEIVGFAAAVRAALTDLPPEEVDELIDGLEADLAESLAEDGRRRLPDPVAYAAELRAAAGLPGPTGIARKSVLTGLLGSVRATRGDVTAAIRRSPARAEVLDFLSTLRPAWWIVRAWLATWLAGAFFGSNFGFLPEGAWWLVLLAATVVSVAWGEGRWRFRGVAPLIAVGNVIAVVALVPVVHAADSRVPNIYQVAPYQEELPDLTGVYLNGNEVTNIFGYDAQGRRLDNVQLFDQDGQPLASAVPGANGCLDADCITPGLWKPSILRNSTLAWNVYPMQMIEAADDEGSGLSPVAGAEPQDRVAPFERVPGLVVAKKDAAK